MKLYRTRTQEEYDWLMKNLETVGYKWSSGEYATESKIEDENKGNIVVYVEEGEPLTFDYVKDVDVERLKSIIEVSELMKNAEHPLTKIIHERNRHENDTLDAVRYALDELVSDESVQLVEQHKQVCKKLNETYAAKNHDYGNSFGDSYKELGAISAVTRIYDKTNRLVSLVKKKEQKVNDESLKDTASDLANYAIMLVMELENNE